jgi:hypothetical protein
MFHDGTARYWSLDLISFLIRMIAAVITAKTKMKISRSVKSGIALMFVSNVKLVFTSDKNDEEKLIS